MRSELFWNWSWRRDEGFEPVVRPSPLKPHLIREDVTKIPDADGMWDCTRKPRLIMAHASVSKDPQSLPEATLVIYVFF